MLAVFGGFTLFFVGAAIFGSQSPGLAAVLAVLFGACTANTWRQGLYTDPTGVRIVLPGRLKARRIAWSDIDRFEVRSGAGQSPVTLIRAPDHEPVAVPTFPRPRKPVPPNWKKYHAKVQGQVDELNQLLAQYQRPSA
jgi:hypothetical protein